MRVGWREMVRPESSCHDDVVVEWAGKRGKNAPTNWGGSLEGYATVVRQAL